MCNVSALGATALAVTLLPLDQQHSRCHLLVKTPIDLRTEVNSDVHTVDGFKTIPRGQVTAQDEYNQTVLKCKRLADNQPSHRTRAGFGKLLNLPAKLCPICNPSQHFASHYFAFLNSHP